ncbi:hypothetical protein B0H14DRAFT_2713312 [Mycena olivaceomarginata]|nr:hypothetical protein B0H14DRAFT_2993851 [Mycena olivaceomarginata]KAJ7876854.1 hypothetical protein B0H14DRAFT_2713312 [Mycena olivaceomarginata]
MNQQWLVVRLHVLGSILVFLVGILPAVGVDRISPGQIGLILIYTTSWTQMFAVTTRLSVEVEVATHASTPENKPTAWARTWCN